MRAQLTALTSDASAALALTELFIKQTRSRASVRASRQPVGDDEVPPPCVLEGQQMLFLIQESIFIEYIDAVEF